MSNETIASEVLAASLGGAVSAAVLYPLEVLKVKMQADDDSECSMIEYAKLLYERQGLKVFFQGVEVSSMQSAIEKSLYFFAYTALKEVHRTMMGPNNKLDVVTNLALGCCAEWAHLPITLPVDAWTTKIQTTSNAKPIAILLTMLNEKTNFYKGIEAYTLLCFKPALQYTVYEQVKQIIIGKHRTSLSAGEAFVLGMIARTISTVIVFPFLRAKVVMQSSNETNLFKVLKNMLDNGTLFNGIAPELTRGVLSSALMLMIKERIAALVRKVLEK